MTTELYKQYRPQTLNEIVGQRTVVSSLKKFLKSETLPHTILLSGKSGIGKTTIARILATELEVNTSADYFEVNAASDRGIELIRDIEKRMEYSPMGGKVRMWVLDESHMLNNFAQQSFLKILEDTGTKNYFILLTSEPTKLIKAIHTRCTTFELKELSEEDLNSLIDSVAEKEGIVLSEKVRSTIITSAAGSARLALVNLELVSSIKSEEGQLEVLKTAEENPDTKDFFNALMNGKNWKDVAAILPKLQTDPEGVRKMLLGWFGSMLVKGWGGNIERAGWIMNCFREPIYEMGYAGLILCSYEAFNGAPK